MLLEEAVRAYVQRRIDRAEFIVVLKGLGVSEEAALGYALALGTAERRQMAMVGVDTLEEADPAGLLADEIRAVEAIASRIVPTTDTPGATEAGAAEYVRRALADAYRALVPRYRSGLRELDSFCASTLGGPFVGLTDEQQDETLAKLADGTISEEAAEFFQLVRSHVLEGMFCEPSYGGNRGLVGWSLVGFPGQRYGYPDPYINRAIDLPPVAVDGPPEKDL